MSIACVVRTRVAVNTQFEGTINARISTMSARIGALPIVPMLVCCADFRCCGVAGGFLAPPGQGVIR